MNEVAEPVEAEIVRHDEQPTTLFRTEDPAEMIAKARSAANALADVIRSQKLASNIQGKEYVRCEGWTLLGSMLGVHPVCVWTREVENGWEARVEARNRQGVVIGAAEACCLRDEKRWAGADTYAVRSMAQTRATSKALRMPLGFVMNLAGYEVTPAEEIPREGFSPAKPKPVKKLTPAEQEIQDKAREAIGKMGFTVNQVEDFKRWSRNHRLKWTEYVIAAAEAGVESYEKFQEWIANWVRESEPEGPIEPEIVEDGVFAGE